MANDRSRRGGRATGRSGRAVGRGRGENGGELGRGGSTGGARGGRGQPRRGGRGSKRPAGTDANPVDTAASSLAKQPRKIPTPNKKAKVGEARVLWSPTGRAAGKDRSVGEGCGSGDSNGGGAAGSGQNLSSLATSFKQRFGEDVGFDDEDVNEDSDINRTVTMPQQQPQPRRKRSLSSSGGGGGSVSTSAVEEAARSMSPARLAAEAHRARARAREQRFGSGSGGGGGGSQVVPSSTRAAQVKNPPVQRRSTSPSRASSPKNATVSSSIDTNANAASAAAFGQNPPILTASTIPSEPPVQHAGGTSSGVARLNKSHGASVIPPLANELSLPTSATSATSSPRSRSPVAVSTNDVDVARSSVTDPTGKGAATEIQVVSADDPRSIVSAASKRSAADLGGDMAVMERRTKKPSATPLQAPSPTAATAAAPKKVHTLRLRLRTEVVSDPQSKEQRVFDGGVEETKGFEPPNPPSDSGVEECKGFDPPNLPSTPGRQPPPPPPPSPMVPVNLTKRRVTPQRLATAPTIDASERPGSGAGTSASWGPSFGIHGQATAAATKASPPVTTGISRPQTNPWMLSPSAPTFARNQGRPLARSFSSENGKEASARETGASIPGMSKSAAGASNTARPVASTDDRGDAKSVGGSAGQEHDVLEREPAPASTPFGSSTPASSRAVVASVGSGPRGQALPSGDTLPLSSTAAPREDLTGASRDDNITNATSSEAAAAPGTTADTRSEEVWPGLRVGGRAGKLLDKLRREREETLDFDRKLTQALLDL